MKLLLDHCIDRKLVRYLTAHEALTAREMGWDELRNGRLLAAAAEAGFHAVLTIDRGMPRQQNPSTLPITVLVLHVRSSRITELVALVPRIETSLIALGVPRFIEIEGTPRTPGG